jgi:Xaa-Pro aminopeptidase
MALLRRAAEISDEGHRAAMLAPAASHEYELQAALEGHLPPARRRATGLRLDRRRWPNSTLLHYMKDRAAVKPATSS